MRVQTNKQTKKNMCAKKIIGYIWNPATCTCENELVNIQQVLLTIQ